MSKVSPMASIFISLTVTFTVVGQLLIKQGMLDVGASPGRVELLPGFLWRTLTNPHVALGLASAVIAALCWTIAVSRSDLSFAYPFMGLAIVLVLALSPLLLGESVPLRRWLGVLIVCIGLFVASGR